MKASPLRERASRLAPPVLVAAAAALPFLPSLGGGFLEWDDALALLSHDNWRGLSPSHLRWMLTTFHMSPWQPLSWLTYALDHAAWGMNPFGYRLTNLLLHAGGAALAFALFDELLRAGAPRTGERDRTLAAAFGALFFAVHPLRVESVCWISERRDVLSVFFYLLALVLYARRARLGGPLWRVWLVFVAACLSKGSAITLPLTMLVLDAYPLKRRAWAEKIPFLAVSIAVGLVGMLGQSTFGDMRTLEQVGLGQRLAVSSYGLWFYLEKTLLPLRLSPVYPVPPGFGLASVVPALAAIIAACAGAWALRRRAPAFAAALAHHAISLAPVIGLVRFGEQLVADHYSHLPGIGWGALSGAAFLAAARGRGRALGAGAIVLAFGAQSAMLAPFWRDDLPLFTRGAALQPGSRYAHANLAHALRKAGRVDEGAEHERLAIELDSGNWMLRSNYGTWLLAKGRTGEAIAKLREAHRLQPGSPEVRKNLSLAVFARGNELGRAGRLPEAEAAFREVLTLAPGDPEASANLKAVRRARGF